MRSNFICIRFIGIVFDAVWLQRLCFFLSDFFEFGRFQKIFSFSKKIIIKTNLLCCPAPFLQYRFCGSAFCRVYSELRFIGLLFYRIYSASLLWFRFLLRLFSFGSAVCFFAAFIQLRFSGFAFCCFFLFTLPLFCFSDSVYFAFFLSFFSAMFLLPRFSCSVFQSAKSLKKCFKNFYGLAKSVSRPYPYHIYSNFIQSYSKNQDSICFFSRLLLLLVLLLKRAALLKVEPPVLY